MQKFALTFRYGKGFGLTQNFTSWNPPNGVVGIAFYILLLLVSKFKIGNQNFLSYFFYLNIETPLHASPSSTTSPLPRQTAAISLLCLQCALCLLVVFVVFRAGRFMCGLYFHLRRQLHLFVGVVEKLQATLVQQRECVYNSTKWL